MLALGLPRAMIDVDRDLVPRARTPPPRDITEAFYARLLKPVPKCPTGQIGFTSSLLIGWQGSGKTDTISYDLYRAYQYYGRDNVEAIHTNSYAAALGAITGTRPVVFIIIDDAMKEQNSRRSMSAAQASLAADYNETRHVFERRSSGRILNAQIIVETAVQRWHGLDITLRSSAELIRFKTGESDRRDRDTVRDYIGDGGLVFLDEIWQKAARDPRYKSLSVGRIANIQPPLGVGICTNGYMQTIDPLFALPPKIVDIYEASAEGEPPPAWTPEDPLADLRDGRMRHKVLAYELAQQGMKQTDIADVIGRTCGIRAARNTVSVWIGEVRSIVAERAA